MKALYKSYRNDGFTILYVKDNFVKKVVDVFNNNYDGITEYTVTNPPTDPCYIPSGSIEITVEEADSMVACIEGNAHNRAINDDF